MSLTRFTIVESSEFAFYERVLREGYDVVKPVAEQLQALRFNFARIWLANISVHHLIPTEWLDFYKRLPELVEFLARYGIYPDFTVFTQPGDLMPSTQQQIDHLSRVYEALHDQTCILSKVNENDVYPASRLSNEALALRKPDGARFLVSNGSNGAGAQTVTPTADVGEYHSNDLSQWQRKVGHNAMEENADPLNVPTWASENTRSDKDGYNVVHAYDAARNGSLLCAGSCCHTPEGKLAQPFMQSLEWARNWADGAQSVRLEFQDGQYAHFANEEKPGIIRVHARVLNGEAERSIVRA